MYRLLFLFLLITIGGCNVSVNQSPVDTFKPKCPQQSPSLSESENLEMSSTNVSRSGLLDSNNGKAYQFEGESGQILSFSLDNDEICTWVFDPSGNQIDLTSSAEMPMDGTYSLYLWNPQGKKTFNLTIGLQDKPQPVAISTPKVDTEISNYPKYQCGDSLPPNREDYPVYFYPVNIPFSENTLSFVQRNFCQDAFRKRDRDTGRLIIQVASFRGEEKAQGFSDFVGLDIGNVYVGSPTVINSP